MLCILTSPLTYRTLQEEIDPATLSTPVVRDEEAGRLVYLQAVILEGIRMHPPPGAPLPRVTPPEWSQTTNVDDLAGYQPNPSKGFDVSFTRHTGAYSGWNPITQGGSGSPMFIVINNEPVLISVLHYMRGIEALGGPSVADLTVQINSAMATLQGGRSPYQLTAMHFRK